MSRPPDVLAAGAVVRRSGREVLLVHRPRYDDWSFPKGKLDPGEHPTAAAVREVGEETGVAIRLGPPLASQRYVVAGGRHKIVRYWMGQALGGEDVSDYAANEEIDEVAWMSYDQAIRRLSYDHDRRTLTEALELPRRSEVLVVLRHAAAEPRRTWAGDDRLRPLAPEGRQQARALVPVLAAYDPGRVVTSSSTRCVETVTPFARASGWPCEREDGLSEENATAGSVLGAVDELLHESGGAVLCTHRPVLPSVLDAVGVSAITLPPAGMVVVHHREGAVLRTESHGSP